ncbi:TPA: hypothetical protein ACH3X1_011311 [Trebouxia sp. C0004]
MQCIYFPYSPYYRELWLLLQQPIACVIQATVSNQLISCAVYWQSASVVSSLVWHWVVCWVSTKLFRASRLMGENTGKSIIYTRASEAQLHIMRSRTIDRDNRSGMLQIITRHGCVAACL